MRIGVILLFLFFTLFIANTFVDHLLFSDLIQITQVPLCLAVLTPSSGLSF